MLCFKNAMHCIRRGRAATSRDSQSNRSLPNACFHRISDKNRHLSGKHRVRPVPGSAVTLSNFYIIDTMGITGLLPVIKPIGEATTALDLRNKRVGIDAHGWLHRSTYSCALELCRNEPTTAFIEYCLHRVRLLQANGVTPILVFDGAELPQKAATHQERRSTRAEALARAEQAYASGDVRRAREWYQRGCPVTSAMAARVMRAARERLNVECLVAPYEADAQLAWMMRSGYVDVVISEDSDLLVYSRGAGNVLYKFEAGRDGSSAGLMIRLDAMGRLPDLTMGQFTPDMFMYMCVCAGCDFFKGVKGLGIRKAHAFVKRHRTLPRIIRAVSFDRKLGVDRRTFAHDFVRACLVFRHQTVFDLRSRRTVPLTPIDPLELEQLPDGCVVRTSDATAATTTTATADDWDLNFLGKHLDPDIAQQIADGIINPHTLEKFPPEEPVTAVPRSRVTPTATRRFPAHHPSSSSSPHQQRHHQQQQQQQQQRSTPNPVRITPPHNANRTQPLHERRTSNPDSFVIQPASNIRTPAQPTKPTSTTTPTSAAVAALAYPGNNGASRRRLSDSGVRPATGSGRMMTSGSSFDPRREARRFSLSNNVGRTTTNASASVSAPASVISSGGGMGSSGRSSLITDTAKSFAPHFTSSAAVWTKFKRASIVGEEAGPSSDFDNTSKPNNERSHSVNVSYIYGDNDDEVSPHRSSAQQVSTSSTPQTSSPFSPSNPAVCVSDTAAAASVAADFVAVVDEDKNINDKNNNVVEDTNIQDVVDKDATSLDDGTVNLETQAVEPCLESTDHLETIEETNRTSIDNNDALYPCVPDTDDGDIETNNDGGASGAEELAVEEEGCKSSGADKKRPRSNGISKIMRRFAAHPIDKRLKFANPVATVFEREQKSVATTCNDGAGMNKRSDSVKRKQASHNTTGPPSPDHDSYRLFDEIDELSRDGAALPTGAGITGQAGGWGGVGSHVGRTPTVNLARRQSLPSSSQRNRGRGSMFSKKSLPRAESIIKSGVGKPSKRSPGKAGSSTLKTPGKQQVLVSRFFTSATSASPSSSKTATDSHNRPAAAVDGPQTHQPRIATNASATKEASSSDSPDGNGDGDGDDNNDYNDNTDDEGTALRKDNQVASKATRSKAATAQSTGSPSSRVETAMAAVACAASDRRRSQKRKIDNFRRGAAGKKIRVGSD